MSNQAHVHDLPDSLITDTLAFDEYLEIRRPNRVFCGEQALLFAVLVDALDVYAKTVNSVTTKAKNRLREVVDWFGSGNTDNPFSFECICEVLGLNPASIRSALKTDRLKSIKTVRRFAI